MDPEAAAWGFLTMGIITLSWIGLSTKLIGTPRIIVVCICMSAFIINILILCNITWHEDSRKVLKSCVALEIVCVVTMMILFNKREFYIMENIAFVSYNLTFLFFFIVHTPSHWNVLPDTFHDELVFENEMDW